MTAADGRGVTPDLRGPAERAEPCPVPWPGLHAETNRCVFPYGHEVHWNGAGDVWLSDLAAAEARGVERGYRRAVDIARNRDRFRAWALQQTHLDAYQPMTIPGAFFDVVVDYLEAVEGDEQ